MCPIKEPSDVCNNSNKKRLNVYNMDSEVTCGSPHLQVCIHLGRQFVDSISWSMCLALSPAHLWTSEPSFGCPNNNVGLESMVFNLESLLTRTATNSFGNGYYQGSAEAPLEAASTCPGIYGKGAYHGYAGELFVDSMTGASYNAHSINERKYLLGSLYDLTTSSCSTLVYNCSKVADCI
ncbi:hypothetical protein NE237_004479 [Protea cynaroides]|uniref:Uncharacterized protein n=1 Tax=Protea cynaroides TaxID=273540 RepID=A0A9Q0QTD6_9MAGN|nr:hypothetical protein NE237_004479 [Protea cynaroides]